MNQKPRDCMDLPKHLVMQQTKSKDRIEEREEKEEREEMKEKMISFKRVK